MNPASPSVPTSANGSEAAELPLLRVCGRCGATSTTRFCGECGTPLDDTLPGVRGFLREGAAEIAGFDSRLLNTVRDLLLHPVRIIRAYMSRNAPAYVPVVRVFFTVAGIYIAVLALTQPYDAGTQLSNALAGTPSMDQVTALLQKRGLTLETVWARYNARLNALFPLIAAFAVPVYALVLWVLNRGRTLVEHAIFAMALSNVASIIGILVLPLAFWSNRVQMVASLGVSSVYCLTMYYHIYRRPSRMGTALRAVVFTVVASMASMALTVVLITGVFISALLF